MPPAIPSARSNPAGVFYWQNRLCVRRIGSLTTGSAILVLEFLFHG